MQAFLYYRTDVSVLQKNKLAQLQTSLECALHTSNSGYILGTPWCQNE